MKRLCWSKLFSSATIGAAAIVSAFAATPTIQVRAPGVSTPDQKVTARIPASYTTANPIVANPTQSVPKAMFEGPNVTDYFNFERNYADPANPQIAAGPSDLLLIVNRQIFRLPNGNNAGVVPPPLNPFATQAIGAGVAQKAFLDVWIGERAMNELCPTQPRTSASCLFENTTVKYDQMHGRFVVLFTVTDTGLTQQNGPQGQLFYLTNYRKASWVLLVSRYAILADTAATTLPSNSDVFVTPTPPNEAITGGVNNLWSIAYGRALNALGTDNFGAYAAATPPVAVPTRADGVDPAVVSPGNINALPGVLSAADNQGTFDCSPTAVYAENTLLPGGGATVAKVCYFPTSARLGLDNDTITIASSVINVNINPSNMSNVYDPAPVAPAVPRVPAFAGTRVRVIKKSAIYTKAPGPVDGATFPAGNQWAAGGFAARAAGAYYDLYTSPNGTQLVPEYSSPAVVLPTPYTVLANYGNGAIANPAAGTNIADIDIQPGTRVDGTSTTLTRLAPVHFEPQHLRGRAMATYSNSPALGANGAQNSQSYLVGAMSAATGSTFRNNFLFVQGVRHIYNTACANCGNAAQGLIPFYPILQTGSADTRGVNINDADVARQGAPAIMVVPDIHTNPAQVLQNGYRPNGTTAAPSLYVGDNRPHSVIFREGHLYDARVASLGVRRTFSSAPVSSTVVYDVIQKLHATLSPFEVIDAKWASTDAYAPMFDVPANVSQTGQVSPINLLPYLEKLFVATTYPPLAGFPDNDPNWNFDYTNVTKNPPWSANPGQRTPVTIAPALDNGTNPTIWSTSTDPRTRDDSSNPKQALASIARCYSYFEVPNNTQPADSQRAWPGLFDMRCGEDPYDTVTSQRDPVSGRFLPPFAVYTIRGGASTDPNDGSMWNLGAYARKRLSTFGTGQWGTFGANYKMSMPDVDPYGNAYSPYTDLAGLSLNERNAIEIARRVGIAPPVANPANPTFAPNEAVKRREMARWVVKSQMDEAAITNYLTNSPAIGNGGFGLNVSSFADVPTTDPDWRYIEVMARRGYTSGCAVDGVASYYCPDNLTTRREMAVFLIRAKLSNVFNTVLSGCPAGTAQNQAPTAGNPLFPWMTGLRCGTGPNNVGDNFGYFVPRFTYFADNPDAANNTSYAFIQKMKELGITNGTSLGPLGNARDGRYEFGRQDGAPAPDDPGILLRKQIAVFMTRAFFY